MPANPLRGREPRRDDACEFGEGDGHGCDRGGLNDEKHRPAVEESEKRPERFAQVNVLAASVRHCRGKLAKAQRADQCDQAGSEPDHEQQPGTLHLVRDVRRNDKNPGADHRADDDHRRIEQAETFDQFAGGWRGCGCRNWVSICHRCHPARRLAVVRPRAFRDRQIFLRSFTRIGRGNKIPNNRHRIRPAAKHVRRPTL